MVTCELSRVCWLRRSQHNMQHMQITRRREKGNPSPLGYSGSGAYYSDRGTYYSGGDTYFALTWAWALP